MSGETDEQPSAWTIDSLHSALLDALHGSETRFGDQVRHVRELIETNDRRYSELFRAQEVAMSAALAAAEKAVAAALAAAEKATTKAEVAGNVRFEAVNEFRGQLADQAATFLPRTEFAALNGALADKVVSLESRMQESLQRVHSRLDRGDGMIEGGEKRTDDARAIAAEGRARTNLMLAVVGGIVAVIGIVVTVVAFATR